jgi:hypothetical protein
MEGRGGLMEVVATKNDMGVSSGSPLSHHPKHWTRQGAVLIHPNPASWCSHHAALAPMDLCGWFVQTTQHLEQPK